MVTGSGSKVGQAIIDHPAINGITFTGSDSVGKRVAQGAVARGAKYQLEMGGKNPVIVMDDADLDLAVEATISGAFRSTGQKCTATSRVFVQRKVYEAFRDKLLAKVERNYDWRRYEAGSLDGTVCKRIPDGDSAFLR